MASMVEGALSLFWIVNVNSEPEPRFDLISKGFPSIFEILFDIHNPKPAPVDELETLSPISPVLLFNYTLSLANYSVDIPTPVSFIENFI